MYGYRETGIELIRWYQREKSGLRWLSELFQIKKEICTDLHRLAWNFHTLIELMSKIIFGSWMIIIDSCKKKTFAEFLRLVQTCKDLKRLAKTCINLHDTFTHLLSQCQRVLQDLKWLSLILVRIKKLAQTFADLHRLTQTCTNFHCTLGYLQSYFQMM